ncbi:unnamed protein product [Camellia sinensis]
MGEMGEMVVESELSRAFMAISVSLSGYGDDEQRRRTKREKRKEEEQRGRKR